MTPTRPAPRPHAPASSATTYNVPGLQIAEDGSLTIYLQHESPGKDKEANWLPTPHGDFRPMMRMYQARPEILTGDYALPAISKVGWAAGSARLYRRRYGRI